MTTRFLLFAATLAFISSSASAATIQVRPGNRIQNAIRLSKPRDTIVVSPGVYRERLNLMGKNILLRSTAPTSSSVVSSTIVNGGGSGPVITFSGSEVSTCVISGFTLTNGSALSGGAIKGNGARAVIQNSNIVENRAENGGAIANFRGTIQNNNITSNTAEANGGAIYNCNGTIQNNIIFGNRAGQEGGGIAFSPGIIQNNIIRQNSARQGGGLAACNGRVRSTTIYSNMASQSGGGIFDCDGPTTTIQNCIIWANRAPQGAQIFDSDTPSYSCIQNWRGGGVRNISADPLFANPRTNDLHLMPDSPAIDAGADLGEFVGTSQNMRVVFAGGGYEKEHIRFDTYLASWPAYKDLPRGSALKLNVVSSSITLGNIMLGRSDVLETNSLEVGPNGQTNLIGDIVTTGVQARFTVQSDGFSTGSAEIRIGLSCAGRTDRTTVEALPGGSQTLTASLEGSFTAEQLSEARAFIYSRTRVGAYEMVGDASQRLQFTLTEAVMTVFHDQTSTGSLRDFEGDSRPYDGSTARRGDGSDFDMGADEFDGTQFIPDLLPEYLRWNEAGLNDGQQARVDLRIRNRGRGISTTCTYTVSVDGVEKIRALTPPIGANGGSFTRSGMSLGLLTSGTHTITAQVDVNKTQKESNEHNNIFSRTTNVAANLADLQATEMTFTSTTLNSSQNVLINVLVTNGGIAGAPSSKYAVQIDGVSKTTRTLTSMSAGTTKTLQSISLGKLSAGNHEVMVLLDSAGSMRETNEGNNTISRAINISQQSPDLIMEFLTLPSMVTSADDLVVGISIKNIGDAASTASKYSIAVDGAEKIRSSIPAIGVSGTWTTQGLSLGRSTEGLHGITAIADVENILSEPDEHNNQITQSIEVHKVLSDLRVDKITLKSTAGASADMLRYTADITIINSGQAPSESCHYSIFIDGKDISTPLLPELGVQEIREIKNLDLGEFYWTEKHEVEVRVDFWNTVIESNEKNNFLNKPFGFANRAAPEWSLY